MQNKNWLYLVAALLIATTGTAVAAPMFSLQLLEGVSYGSALNDTRLVVGQQQQLIGGPHGVLWSAVGLTDLGRDLESPHAVNNSGVVVGSHRSIGNVNGFRWEAGNVQQFNQRIVDINDAGQLVMQPPFIGNQPRPTALNEAGLVVGDQQVPPLGRRHATLWDNDAGTFTDLGVLYPSENATSTATDINNAGQVVGHSDGEGFVWQGGVITALSPNRTDKSQALSINEASEIVGLLSFVGFSRAMYYTPDTGLVDLNTLLAPLAPGALSPELFIATGINELGQILANGRDQSDRTQAYLLTPIAVDAPGPLALMFLVGLALALRRHTALSNVGSAT